MVVKFLRPLVCSVSSLARRTCALLKMFFQELEGRRHDEIPFAAHRADDCDRRRAHARRGAGPAISEPTHPHHRAESGRGPAGHAVTHHREAIAGAGKAVGGGGESPRRQRRHRHSDTHELCAGRLHLPDVGRRHPVDQPADLSEAALQSKGRDAGRVRGARANLARCQPEGAGNDHAGVCRLRQSQFRHGYVRHVRRRQLPSSVDGGGPVRARREAHPCAVQGIGRIQLPRCSAATSTSCSRRMRRSARASRPSGPS